MKTFEEITTVLGKETKLSLMSFEDSDRMRWKELFDMWKGFKIGMREYKAREPNFPEGLSEVAFCLFSGSYRVLPSRSSKVSNSFDTFNLDSGRAEQIKATGIKKDLTSFRPKSKWDDLYFLDFFNNDKLDGTFNVFKIPNELIYSHKVNKLETFTQQQDQRLRPRLSIINSIIKVHNIEAVAVDVKVWL